MMRCVFPRGPKRRNEKWAVLRCGCAAASRLSHQQPPLIQRTATRHVVVTKSGEATQLARRTRQTPTKQCLPQDLGLLTTLCSSDERLAFSTPSACTNKRKCIFKTKHSPLLEQQTRTESTNTNTSMGIFWSNDGGSSAPVRPAAQAQAQAQASPNTRPQLSPETMTRDQIIEAVRNKVPQSVEQWAQVALRANQLSLDASLPPEMRRLLEFCAMCALDTAVQNAPSGSTAYSSAQDLFQQYSALPPPSKGGALKMLTTTTMTKLKKS